MSKFLGDNGGLQKLIELIKTALGLKVSLSNDLSFSAPTYSSANVGKYAVVLSVPTNRRLTLSISSDSNGYGYFNVIHVVGGQQRCSAYQLTSDIRFAIRNDAQAGKLHLCVPCLSSPHEPRKTYNAQVLFYSESDRTEIVAPQTQTIYSIAEDAQTIYSIALKDTHPFNVSSAGVGSIDLENYSSFLGKCPSEMDSVTIHVENELAGQIYNLTFDHDVTDGITIDDGGSTTYCTISETVKAGDVITLTAVSNTSNGWIYSHIGAPIQSPDGSILVEISDGVTKLKVDPEKLTLPDDVLRNHSTVVGDTYNDESLAIGHGSSVSSSSTSVGAYSSASGYNSASFGDSATATGGGATAIGAETLANSGSTAVGEYAAANAYNAVAIGSYAKARGNYSIAIGEGAEAYSEGQIVLGRYNQVNAGDKLIFGCGTAENARANLFGVNSLRQLYGLQGARFEPVSIPGHGSVNGGMLSIAAGKIVTLDNSYATNGNMCWACAVGDCTFQGEELKAGEYRQYIGIGGTWYKMDNGGGGGSSFVESVGTIDAVSGSTQTSEERKAIINSNTVIKIRHDLNLTLSIPSYGIKEGARRIFFKENAASSDYYLRIYFDVMTNYIELEDGVPYLFEFHDGEWRHVEGAILNEELKRMLMIQTTIGNYSETNYSHTSGSVSAQGKVKRLYKIHSAPSSGGSSQSPFIDVSFNFYSKRSGGSSFDELMMDSYFNRLSPYINLDGETVSRMIEWYCKPSVLEINDSNLSRYYDVSTMTLTIAQPTRTVLLNITSTIDVKFIDGIEQNGYRLTLMSTAGTLARVRILPDQSMSDYRFGQALFRHGNSSYELAHEGYLDFVQYSKIWITKCYW